MTQVGEAGTGALDVVRAGGRSVVRRAFASSPLRLLTPRNHGHAAWVYAGSYGGGLVGGDALLLHVNVGDGASAFLSTQASTKVYRSDSATSVEMHARIAPGAALVSWPDPVVCFADSAYDQRQHVDVAAGGALVLVDWMSSGRRASGERWRFDRYASQLTIRYDGQTVLRDSVRLDADAGDLAARMSRFDVLCSATIVGPRFGVAVARILERIAALPVERRAPLLVSAAPVARVADIGWQGAGVRRQEGESLGCIVRIAGASVEQVAGVLRDHLAFVPPLLGDDPWARKW